MEFSSSSVLNSSELEQGSDLIERVVNLTELPPAWIQGEMQQLLEVTGKAPSSVTLTDLREMLLLYLESIDQEFQSQETQKQIERTD